MEWMGRDKDTRMTILSTIHNLCMGMDNEFSFSHRLQSSSMCSFPVSTHLESEMSTH